jgi:hypothetical protein
MNPNKLERDVSICHTDFPASFDVEAKKTNLKLLLQLQMVVSTAHFFKNK